MGLQRELAPFVWGGVWRGQKSPIFNEGVGVFFTSLYVRYFRNLDDARVDFSPRINQVIGKNAEGKTSLLEALYLCMSGSSFRTLRLKDTISYGKEGFFVEARFEKEGSEQVLTISYDGDKRRVLLNSHPVSSSTLLGLIPGVVWTPEDSELIKGAPSVRRRFLDIHLCQKDPLYVRHLYRFLRALKQRNALLRMRNIQAITVWEKELAESAAYLVAQRKKTLDALQPLARDYFAFFTEVPLFTLEYRTTIPPDMPSDEMKKAYLAEFAKKRDTELHYGMTLVGPHRDDFLVLCKERSAKEFASEGQKRLFALSLKLAEWHCMKETLRIAPIMLLDDFGAFLDREKLERLFTFLSQKLGQVFVANHQRIDSHKTSDMHTFQMQQGKITIL